MAWIEFHQALVTHRKLYALAKTLKVRRSHAAGHLAFLWTWAVDNAPDGDLTDVDPNVIKDAADWPKDADAFLAALRSSGFVDADSRLHDWSDYAGRLADKRAANAERMRCARRGHDPCTCAKRAPNVRRTTAERAGLQNSTQQNTTEPSPSPSPSARAAHDDDPGLTRIIRAFDGLTGRPSVNPHVLRQLEDWRAAGVWSYQGQAAEWFEAACEDAARQGATKLSYVLAILEHWQAEGHGFRCACRKGGGRQGEPANQSADAIADEIAASMKTEYRGPA